MPDSDSDNFESADEDVAEEKSVKTPKKADSSTGDSEKIQKSAENSSWKSWSAFGMIRSASENVASYTTKMTQSLSTAIESINIPDPEEMAKQQAEEKKSKSGESVDEDTKSTGKVQGEESSVFKLDSLLSNVGLISSKVVSGGLDTLEGIGKKTMNILQDTDPNIKNKLRGINANRPNLSEILKEAKNSESLVGSSNHSEDVHTKMALASFEHLLEEYSGLVYFEALELLSKQSKMKIDLLLKPLTGKSLMEVEETLKEVEELCELPDSDNINDEITTVTLNEHLSKATEDLSITLNFNEVVSYSLELSKYFEGDSESDSKLLFNKSVESLAKLCSLSLNNYHKMAELMLSQNHRSTADEVDALIQITSVYFSLFNNVATSFSERIGKSDNNLSLEVFIECSNAVTYVKKAFNVFIPIMQIGAL